MFKKCRIRTQDIVLESIRKGNNRRKDILSDLDAQGYSCGSVHNALKKLRYAGYIERPAIGIYVLTELGTED